MTTSHNLPPANPTVVDQALTERCEDSGQYLAGLIAKGMLDHVGRPTRLPEVMFPDVDPDVVRRIWDMALPVGYLAGKMTARPQWTAEGLNRLRGELRDAGYEGMARLTGRSASVHHPADGEAQGVREGGHP
ncbi:hypothetical protein HY68_36770 [Streptomyces sp. AcH 505]|uniref:hypothetical protein n=1 Tax=Streptomyces sp. AcH 505 TaxID=352211 RepID=UPI00059229FC|nr:hypothetical protein HY68_36770 [Streptomyces sp. AcH 505]